MDCCNSNFTPISFYLLLLSPLCFCGIIATSSELGTINPFQDVCSVVNCGQGTCKASNASALGFVCDCHPGWRQIQIGPFTFPSCLLPNCTVDFHCGNRSRSPSAPLSLAPILPPSKNLFSPCGLVWCGDGTCVTNGTGYTCQCHKGSKNLLNSSSLACFKTCYFGADCSSLGLSPPAVPRPQIPQPPPSSNPSSASKGSTNISNSIISVGGLTMILLAPTFLMWLLR